MTTTIADADAEAVAGRTKMRDLVLPLDADEDPSSLLLQQPPLPPPPPLLLFHYGNPTIKSFVNKCNGGAVGGGGRGTSDK